MEDREQESIYRFINLMIQNGGRCPYSEHEITSIKPYREKASCTRGGGPCCKRECILPGLLGVNPPYVRFEGE